MAELFYINGSGTNVYGGYYTGQSFLATDNWSVESIWIDSVRTLTGTYDVYCSIYLDSGGSPIGSALGTSDAVSCTNTLEIKTFTFSTSVELTSGNTYWAILECGGATYVWFVRTNSSVYADGEVGAGNNSDLSDFLGDSAYDCRQFKVNGGTWSAGSQEVYLSNVSMRGLNT